MKMFGLAGSFFAAVTLLTIPVHAQSPAPVPIPGPASSIKKARNVVRLDIFNPCIKLLATPEKTPGPKIQVLASYERQWDPHVSLGAEVLLNGGDADEHRTGGSLLIRYYPVLPNQPSTGPLDGFYLSPVLSYRKVRYTDPSVQPGGAATVRVVGGGLYAGWQDVSAPSRHGQSVVVDVAMGVMGWNPEGGGLDSKGRNLINTHSRRWLYARYAPDARLGIGLQF